VDDQVPKFIVDPKLPEVRSRENLYLYQEKASTGMEKVKSELLEKYI